MQHYGMMSRTYVAPPKGPYKEFALRFREACHDAGMPETLKGLSRLFGVSTTTVHEWRHGEKLPSSDSIRLIAEKTGVSYDWLATGRGAKAPPADDYSAAMARRIAKASPEVRRYIEAILSASENHPPENDPHKSDCAVDRRAA